MRFSLVALFLSVSLLAIASPLPWSGAPAYSGASSSTNGGNVTGGGGINLIKVLSHDGAPGGDSISGTSSGGDGGRNTVANNAKRPSGGSAGGAGFTGATGTSEGGSSQTDNEITLLDVLSDNAASGGQSASGEGRGGGAGDLLG